MAPVAVRMDGFKLVCHLTYAITITLKSSEFLLRVTAIQSKKKYFISAIVFICHCCAFSELTRSCPIKPYQ